MADDDIDPGLRPMKRFLDLAPSDAAPQAKPMPGELADDTERAIALSFGQPALPGRIVPT